MEDLIRLNKDGSLASISGPNGYRILQVSTLISLIELYVVSKGRIIPSLGITLRKMLDMAEKYTGQVYKRTQTEKAISDLKVWLETMKSTIPVEIVK